MAEGNQGYESYAGYGSREWRNRIALEMLRKKRETPTTIGAGINSIGQSIGDVLTAQGLDERERARDAALGGLAAARPLPGMPQAAPAPGSAPVSYPPIAPPAFSSEPPLSPEDQIAGGRGFRGPFDEASPAERQAGDATEPVPLPTVDPRGLAGRGIGQPRGQGPTPYGPPYWPSGQLAEVPTPPLPALPAGNPQDIRPQAAGGIETGPRSASFAVAEGLPDTAPGEGRNAITAAIVPPPAAPAPPAQMAALGGAGAAGAPAVVAPPPVPPNPVITRPDITPLPRTAQAGGFAGAIPGPMAPAAPEPPPPSVGRTTQALQPLPPRPKPPILDQTLTPEETHGWRMVQQYPNDPDVKTIAEPYIKFGQQKRQSELAQRQEQYKADEASWIKEFELRKTRELDAPKIEADLRKQELELAEAEQRRQETARRGGVTPEQAFTVIKESHKDAASIPGEVAAIRNAQRVLPQAVTGLGADAKVNILRVLAAAGQPVDPSISATQQFQSYVKGVYGRLRPAVIGAGPQANAEGKVLEKAAAGDISMDPDAIKAVLNSIYALNVIAAKEHQNKIAVYTNTNPNAQQYAYGTFGLKMEDIVPDSAVRVLRQHYKENPAEAIKEFNTDFRTPGLAQQILGLGD
jgi:hypothetical protein